jgi:hypothetical protein
VRSWARRPLAFAGEREENATGFNPFLRSLHLSQPEKVSGFLLQLIHCALRPDLYRDATGECAYRGENVLR